MPKTIEEMEQRFLEEQRQDLKEFYAGYLGYDFVEEHGAEIRDYATALSPFLSTKEAERFIRK